VGTGFTRQDVNVKDETVTLGDMRWQYKDDVDLYGIAFAKEIAGISVGMDLVYRKNAPLPPELGSALFRYAGEADPAAAFAAGDSSNYGGAIGETWHVVINGLGLLNDNGFWEGGSWILEATFSGLDDCTDNCDFLSSNVHDNRVSTHIGGVFSPTWFQVFPGIDLSVPIAFGYGVDGDSAPIGFGGFEETGSASVGLRFDINQKIEAVARYNAFFGPATNGIGALLKDRDNVSFTVKATF
jgi:hypothetical protein